jgi:hypothetical protein
VRIDVDRNRHLAELAADERKACLVLANRRLALGFEYRIDQRKLPRRRGFFGENAVAPAKEMQIFSLVADLIERGKAGANVKVDVAEIGMLRHVKANRDGRRIAVADLEIDVAHRRIERVRSGVRDGIVGRHGARRRKRHPPAGAAAVAGTSARKHHHHAHAILKARRVIGQHQDGARGSVAEDAHARPHKDGPREPVSPRWYEDDALAGVAFGFVDRGLDRGAVVGGSIGVSAELLRGEVDRLWVV